MNTIRTLMFAALVGLTGCTAACRTEPGSQAAPPARSAPAVNPAAQGFGGTDLAWIEINIAMDEQLLPLLDLVPARSTNADVKALVAQVKAFTDAELGTLRQLHDEAGLSATNPHEGMPMPGMVTPEQVAAAAKLTGAGFDKAVVQQIKGHLEQSTSLAHSEDKSGAERRTKGLALQVLRTREQALSTLPKTLK